MVGHLSEQHNKHLYVSLNSYYKAYLRFKACAAQGHLEFDDRNYSTSIEWVRGKIVNLIDEIAYYDSIPYVTCGQSYPLRAGIPREFVEDTSPISEILRSQDEAQRKGTTGT